MEVRELLCEDQGSELRRKQSEPLARQGPDGLYFDMLTNSGHPRPENRRATVTAVAAPAAPGTNRHCACTCALYARRSQRPAVTSDRYA